MVIPFNSSRGSKNLKEQAFAGQTAMTLPPGRIPNPESRIQKFPNHVYRCSPEITDIPQKALQVNTLWTFV